MINLASNIPLSLKQKHLMFPLLGYKLKHTTVVDSTGTANAVSVINIKDLRFRIKFTGKDFSLISVLFDSGKLKQVNKSLQPEHLLDGNCFKHVRYFWLHNSVISKLIVAEDGTVNLNHVLELVSATTYLNAIGISKSKGFCGVMKRHGFSGGPASHGSSLFHRGPGSVGQDTPSRILPGSKLPGRHGGRQVTIKNLKILSLNTDSTITIKGTIPGSIRRQTLISLLIKI